MQRRGEWLYPDAVSHPEMWDGREARFCIYIGPNGWEVLGIVDYEWGQLSWITLK
mgnify:FL=1